MSNASINAVVFDLGGVLIDWDPEYLYSKLIPDDAARRDFLSNVCTRAWHSRHDAGVSFADNAKELLRQYENNPTMQGLIRAWGERYGEMFHGTFPDVVKILTELHVRNVPLYALTNWSSESFARERVHYDFLSFFGNIVVSGDERIIKPDIRLYKILIERTKIDPPTTLYIDDTLDNLEPAGVLGFKTFHHTTAVALRSQLQHYRLL